MVVPVMAAGVCLTAAFLVASIFAVSKDRNPVLWKGIASTGFLITAYGAGAFGSGPGALMFAALVFCWFGDVILAYEGKKVFVAGLVSFLLAHVFLITAFLLHGVSVGWVVAAIAGAAISGAAILGWLYPRIGAEFRAPVLTYMAVISVMTVFSIGIAGAGGPLVAALGAVLFYFSDVFVARQQFVAKEFANTLLGLPVYYAGVVLLAISIAFV